MITHNCVNLLGNLGSDAEIRTLANGDRVANIRVATSDTWRDRTTGELRSSTEWHRASCFVPYIVDYLDNYGKKGLTVFLTGSLTTRKYVSDGVEKYSTEIRIDTLSGIPAKQSQAA